MQIWAKAVGHSTKLDWPRSSPLRWIPLSEHCGKVDDDDDKSCSSISHIHFRSPHWRNWMVSLRPCQRSERTIVEEREEEEGAALVTKLYLVEQWRAAEGIPSVEKLAFVCLYTITGKSISLLRVLPFSIANWQREWSSSQFFATPSVGHLELNISLQKAILFTPDKKAFSNNVNYVS